MKIENVQKYEFEYRIFISLGIVISICLLSFIFFPNNDSVAIILGEILGIDKILSSRIYFLLISSIMIVVSILRMWGGSILSSALVMSFKVQSGNLLLEGPYLLVRNPIYLADFIAITACAFCFPPIGLLMPVLFYFHYSQLILFEEKSFKQIFPTETKNYYKNVPRLFPTFKSIASFIKRDKKILINYDGMRHNSLYMLFIPGFVAAAFLDNFVIAIIIGLPGIIDWAIIHTKIGYKKENSKNKKKTKKVFNDILYSQCWEDPQLDRAAFQISENDTVFSITSGGCNTLTFLIDNPKKIISLDLSPYQNYLLELKILLFQKLSYGKLLEFIGVRDSSERIKKYKSLRKDLSKGCRNYWDANLKKIELGIIHCGRYETYMKLVRIFITAAIGKKLVKKLFDEENKLKRIELFEEKVNNVRWKIVTKFILSKKIMSLIFDKEFFKYLNDSFSFGEHFSQKAKHALTELPIKENYFLSYILIGKYYSEKYLPVYLKPENYNLIKSRTNRIEIVTDNCAHYFSMQSNNVIDKFNMSNIFEWMNKNEFNKLLDEICRVARNEAVLTYRNLLVKRESSHLMRERIIPLKQISESLHQEDLSFIYNNYIVEKINKEDENVLQS